MNTPKCKRYLTRIENRKIAEGCVFCMNAWKDVQPDETCFDCAENEDCITDERIEWS